MRRLLLVVVVVLGVIVAILLALVLAGEEPVGPGGDSGVALPESRGAVPDDRILFSSDRTGTFELFSMGLDGEDVVQLTDDDRYDTWWPRMSPDRRRVLFHRSPAGVHDTDFTKVSLWAMAADGSELTELRPIGADGWDQQGHAEWSPDGSAVVMFGGSRSNPQIFLTDERGQNARQLTDRGGTNVDPSFSPEGDTVAFIGCPRAICFPSDYEVYTVAADGSGEPARLTEDDLRDHDPYYSPDGSEIAFLTETEGGSPVGSWNIRIMDADGGNVRRLTDDDNINSKPEWSQDGERLYFHRLVVGVDETFSIWEISRDGSDLRELTQGQPGVNEFPDT